MKPLPVGKRPVPSVRGHIRTALYSLAILLLLGPAGCAIKKEGFKIEEHVIMVNGSGDLIDPHANVGAANSSQHVLFTPYPELGNPNTYFNDLFTSINEKTPPGTGGKRRILLYVHGGMNTARSSIERATKYSQEILASGTYPIFINWDSSLTSSYLDHLLTLRQGRVAEDWCCGAWKELGRWRHTGAKIAGFAAQVVTTPPYLALDLVRGTIRLPVDIYGVYAEMISTHWRRTRTQDAEQPYAWPNMNCKTVYTDRNVGITPRADRLLCESSTRTLTRTPLSRDSTSDRGSM